MRRAAILLVLLGLTGFGTWQVLRSVGPSAAQADPWELLPEGTRAVLSLPNAATAWERWAHGCALGTVLKDLPGLQHIEQLAGALSPAHGDFPEVPLLVVWSGNDAGTGELLLIAAPRAEGLHALMPLLGTTANADGPQTLRVKDLPQGWSVLLHRGLLLFGNDAARLKVLADRSTAVHAPDSLLREARSTLGRNATAHLLLRTGAPPGWASAPWSDLFAALPADDGWLALDLEPRADGLIAGGVLMPFASLATQAPADPLPPLRALPATVRWYEQRSLPEDTANESWHEASLVRARAHGPHGPVEWTVLRTDDPLDAARTVGDRVAANAPRRMHRGKLMVQVEGLRTLAALQGDSAPWCVLHEDRCILAQDSTAARIAVDALLDGGTLGEDLALATRMTELAAPALRTWWCDIAAGGLALQHRAVGGPPAPPWDGLGTLLVQLVRTADDKAFMSIALRPARTPGPSAMAPPAENASRAAATGMAWLQAVRNHVNGSQELLAQDSAGVLSLRTPGGLVLWQVPLDGPLLGPALQVDRYHNGKLQLLALTARTLYLIDRNGRAVPGFPVALPAAASAPVACYDYDDDGKLRVLVPLTDGRVLNLGPDGRPVTGWMAPRAGAAITSAAHHLRIRSKDHLLFADASGTLHHLDRRGTQRSTPDLKLPEAARMLTVRPGASGSLVPVWRTADGRLEEAPLGGGTHLLGSGTRAAGTVGADRGPLLWWCTADSLYVHGPGAATTGVALAGPVQEAMLLRLEDRIHWAVREADGHWVLVNARGRSMAEGTASGPAVLTDLEPDGHPELLVLPPQGVPEVLRPVAP